MQRSRKTNSGSLLPIIYTGVDNRPLVYAATHALSKFESDTHHLRTHVTLDFVRARKHRFHQLYFELGQALVDDQSGYRLFDYTVKHRSTSISQITFICRYVGIIDIAYNYPVRPSLFNRLCRLAG